MVQTWFSGRRRNDPDPDPPPRCPRCGAEDTQALGMISSTIYWFTCGQCRHVWGLQGPDEKTPGDDGPGGDR